VPHDTYGSASTVVPSVQLPQSWGVIHRHLESADGRCRRPRRLRVEQGCERLGKIAGRDAVEVERRQQRLDRLRAAHVGRQDRRVVDHSFQSARVIPRTSGWRNDSADAIHSFASCRRGEEFRFCIGLLRERAHGQPCRPARKG